MSNVTTGDIAMVVNNTDRNPCVDTMQGFVFKVGSPEDFATGPGWYIAGRPVRCIRCASLHRADQVFVAFLDADLKRLRPAAEDTQVDQPESLQREVEEGIAHG